MPNQNQDRNQNPNLKPDTNQVKPKNFEKVEHEGKEFSTQNKNPGSYKNKPEVNDPKVSGQPGEYEVGGRDLEGEDEPQPYHDLQMNDRGVGEDKAEGPRDQDNRH